MYRELVLERERGQLREREREREQTKDVPLNEKEKR